MKADTTTDQQGPYILVLSVAAAAACAYLAYLLFAYNVLEGYIDHIEPNMAIASWRAYLGQPIYQEYGAPGMMINPYGPLSYLIHVVVFAFLGGSIALSKLAPSLAIGGAVIVFFLHARRRYGKAEAMAGTMLFIAFVLMFVPYSIWNRPDPFMVLLAALAVAAKDAECRHLGRWTPQILIAVCIGLSVNLKAHSFIYFLPVVVDRCGWNGFRQMAAMALLSVAVFLLPFALPQASLTNYLQILFSQFSGRGVDLHMMAGAARYALYYLLPGLLLAGLLLCRRDRVEKRDAIYFAALFAATVLMLYPASAPGQGSYHFLPLFPVTIDLLLRFSRGYSSMPRLHKGILAVLPLLLLALTLPAQRRLKRNMDRVAAEAVSTEVRAVLESHGGAARLQMGYGQSFDNHRFTYAKPLLVFAGHPMTIDSQAVMETGFVGIDIVGDFITDLRACKTRHWLIPKNEPPFMLHNYYTNEPLFGGIPEAFQQTHEKTATLPHFDLWTCKG